MRTHDLLAIAQEDAFRSIRENFKSSWGQEYALPLFTITICSILVISFIQVFLRPHLARRAARQKLWDELVITHALSKLEEDALRHLAQEQKLEDHSSIFVLKTAFDARIERGRDPRILTELRRKIF